MPLTINEHDQLARQMHPGFTTKLAEHQIISQIGRQITSFLKSHQDHLSAELDPEKVENDFLVGHDNNIITQFTKTIYEQLNQYQIAILDAQLKNYQKLVEQLTYQINYNLLQIYTQNPDLTDLKTQTSDFEKLLATDLTNQTINDWYEILRNRETISIVGAIFNNLYQFETHVLNLLESRDSDAR